MDDDGLAAFHVQGVIDALQRREADAGDRAAVVTRRRAAVRGCARR